MENTCDFEKCYFAQLLDNVEQCPNYVEGWWTPLEGKPQLYKDCAPKRTQLMVQELYNRLTGLQKASEQERNKSHRVNEKLIQLFKNQEIIVYPKKPIELSEGVNNGSRPE
jgi:hypothetical protein